MFKDREAMAGVPGGEFPSACVSRPRMADAAPGPVRLTRPYGLAARFDEWRHRASARLAALDLAPDLAEDVGSKRWLRGAATLLGLTAVALSGWPSIAPVSAAPAMTLDSSSRDEFRSQMIMPLALGGDSGRRMGASALVTPLGNAPERPRLDLKATLSPGDSIERLLARSGVAPAEAGQIAAMVASQVSLSDIAPGTSVDLTLGRRAAPGMPRPVDALAFRARFDLQLAIERRNGRLTLDPRPIRVDTTPLRVRGIVGPSLYLSARAAGAPANAVQQYLRALSEDMDSDGGVQPGDAFDLIVDYKRAATGEAQSGQLLFAGLSHDGRPRRQLVRWGEDGHFIEASQAGQAQQQGLLMPVAGRVTSGFGLRRHPILGYTRLHAGEDLAAPYGSPIYAVTDGTVEFAGWHGGHGNFVKLEHGSGFGTGYGHMSRIAVAPGMHVRRGQVIGYVGSTGLSTGPHLHYEVYRNGIPVDPAGMRFTAPSQLQGPQLAAFRARLAELERIRPGAALTPLAASGPAHAAGREIDRVDTRATAG